MKKNILFIMPSLTHGGGEKSLVTLLSRLDHRKYNVDLFLLNHEGLFMEFIPKEVNLLPLSEVYQQFTLPFRKSVKKLLSRGRVWLAYNRVMFSIKNNNAANVSRREQYNWKYIARSFGRLTKKYDIAVGFLEKSSTYFCVEKVDAAKKIGWIHIDYDNLGMDPEFDNEYFKKLDHIVTVSEECASILHHRFPAHKHKVELMYNIVSPTMIHKMADQLSTDVYGKKDDEVVILSIGRLHYQKGFELAVEACKKLIDRGYKLRWHIIGDGEERDHLTRLIAEKRLQNHFKIIGLKSNPYPYIKQADIYAQTSRFEGKSIAIDEAKILHKPILVTNFHTAKDQIRDGIDGLIVDMESDAIAAGIGKLIDDANLRSRLSANLSRLTLGTEDEINKFYWLINGLVISDEEEAVICDEQPYLRGC